MRIRVRFEKTGKVRWIFINFPLTQIHQNAVAAAEFAVCAARQEKFWPAHDLLYETQPQWARLPNPGPFLVGQDGTSSGVISIPANATAGTHELRLFGASKEASVKFGVQGDPDLAPVSAQADDEREWAPVAFAGAAAVVFVVAVVVSVLRLRGGRRAEA